MKVSLRVVLCVLVCVFFVMPTTVSAQTYDLRDTDVHISLDETIWYVFTRDNIENNAELEELGISYETMYSILYENYAYMDAVLYYDDGNYVEFFLRMKATTADVGNLSDYSDEVVLELADALAQRQSAKDYTVYHTRYKFAKLEYTDSAAYSGTQTEYHLYEFYTVVNNESYTLTFQASFPLGESEYDEILRVVDSVRFDVDDSIKSGMLDGIQSSSGAKATASFWNNVITKTIAGGICGGIIGLILALSQKRKNRQKNDESVSSDKTEE